MSQRKRITAVPEETPDFGNAFVDFISRVMEVHGREMATAYLSIREQEVAAMLTEGAEYPTAAAQATEFLSFRLEAE